MAPQTPRKATMNLTKAALSGALAVIALLAYKETGDILFESVYYNRENYQGYATFMVLAVVAAIGSLTALATSFYFVERMLHGEPQKQDYTDGEVW